MHNKNGPGKTFYFKQFQINHDRCAMKVGTDGVLLGAWCKVNDARRVLDIGTGSGLIALMIAQRTDDETIIDAVEIDDQSAEQALENFSAAPWAHRVRLHKSSIQAFQTKDLYDLIVCNPPYFVNSLKPSDVKRNLARHDLALPFVDLILSAKKNLTPSGLFSVILPFREGNEFIIEAARHGFFCGRKTVVKAKIDKPAERLLLQFSLVSTNRIEGELILENPEGGRSDDYKQLVDHFYL